MCEGHPKSIWHTGLDELLVLAINTGHILESPSFSVSRQHCTALHIDSWPGPTLQHLLAMSYLRGLQSMDMRMPADDCMGYIPSLWTALSCLHSLSLRNCQEISPTLSRPASLRSLTACLAPGLRSQQDFQGLTQLTKLHISLIEPHESTGPSVLLPKGRNVQICHETLDHAGFTQNLQCATQLTSLNMLLRPAMHLVRISMQWCPCLPYLQVINICKI